MAEITIHGQDRAREHCGIPKKAVGKVVEKALVHGLTHQDTAGSLNRYMTSLYFYNKTANNVRLYSGKVFIFNNDRLITIFDIPAKYRDMVVKMLKKKESEFMSREVVII